jgi:hypothetical protein
VRLSFKFIRLIRVLTFLVGATAQGEESWSGALALMHLPREVHELGPTNCVDVLLRSFRSNQVVKALVFMPGATDEFYMFHRARAQLTGASPSVLDAVTALTNQTLIRATFRAPLLLLHTQEDTLEPDTVVEDPATATRLKRERTLPHIFWNDRDWDTVQSALKWPLKLDLRPWQGSRASWHFYRHSFAAWGLSSWEALEATALAGKSRFTVRRNQVVFEPDTRVSGAAWSPAFGQ